MNIIRRNIPNMVTCINLLAGCAAIIFAFHSTDIIDGLAGWKWACMAIGLAAVADFLDGMTARLLHAYSPLGKELDSLSDLVSFGVAPGMLLFNVLASAGVPVWVCWISLLIPLLGALRLARFNVDTRQTTSFIGLPIPANALFWIGYVTMGLNNGDTLFRTPIVVAVIILEALLMVLPMPLFSLKFKTFGVKGNERRWILLLGSASLLCLFGVEAFVWIIPFYALLSIKS